MLYAASAIACALEDDGADYEVHRAAWQALVTFTGQMPSTGHGDSAPEARRRGAEFYRRLLGEH